MEFISRAAVSDECSKVSGWYQPHHVEGMRNLVLKLIAARFEAFFSSPLVFEEEDIAPTSGQLYQHYNKHILVHNFVNVS